MIPGEELPDTLLRTPADEPLSLRAFHGRKLVVYFYPKADTSGCTRQAKEFSAARDAFDAAGTTVIGISKDPPAKLVKFIAKHDLTIPLASDADGDVCETFGVWGEKQMYGRSYMGIERATFLFDADGRLSRVWRKVRVAGHVDDVAAAAGAI